MQAAFFRFGQFILDPAKRTLLRDGKPVAVSGRALDCLCYLILNRNRAVGRDELASAVFGRTNVSDSQLGQVIVQARRAIGDDGQEQRGIRTIQRFGFRWAMEVDSIVAGTADGPSVSVPASNPGPRFSGRKWRWFAAGLAAAAAILLVVRWSSPSPDSVRDAPVLVLPARVQSAADMAWVRLGLMDFVAERLRAAGLRIPPSESTLLLLQRRQQKDPASLRELSKARMLIESEAAHSDGIWKVSVVAADGNGIRQHGQGEGKDLFEAARIACDRLLTALGYPPAGGDRGSGLVVDERLRRMQAALLSNRLDIARALLDSMPEPKQAQWRYQRVQLRFREGEYETALQELAELLETPEGRRDAQFRARLFNSRGAMQIRLDRYAEAERSFDAAVALIDPERHPAEWAQARAGRGVARLAQGNVEGARGDLGEARIQLMRTGDAIGVARVDSNLGHLENRRNRPHEALGYFRKAVHDFEALGAVNELLSARTMLVSMHLDLLQAQPAWAASEQLWALRDMAKDPAQRAMIDINRAEALMHTGRLREAETLLSAPREDTRPTEGQLQHYALRQVELALDSADPATAAGLADAALKRWPLLRDPLRGWMRLRREQAALAADLPSSFRPGELSAGAMASLPDKLSAAIWLRRMGRADAADALYLQAMRHAERDGVPHEIVEAGSAYATWLIERGRLSEAAEIVGRTAPWAQVDFRAAVLQVRLFHAMGPAELWQRSLREAELIAGQRRIPVSLKTAKVRVSASPTP